MRLFMRCVMLVLLAGLLSATLSAQEDVPPAIEPDDFFSGTNEAPLELQFLAGNMPDGAFTENDLLTTDDGSQIVTQVTNIYGQTLEIRVTGGDSGEVLEYMNSAFFDFQARPVEEPLFEAGDVPYGDLFWQGVASYLGYSTVEEAQQALSDACLSYGEECPLGNALSIATGEDYPTPGNAALEQANALLQAWLDENRVEEPDYVLEMGLALFAEMMDTPSDFTNTSLEPAAALYIELELIDPGTVSADEVVVYFAMDPPIGRRAHIYRPVNARSARALAYATVGAITLSMYRFPNGYYGQRYHAAGAPFPGWLMHSTTQNSTYGATVFGWQQSNTYGIQGSFTVILN